MYAVIRTGGKQYRVAKDDIIAIEKLDGKAGDKVKFDEVLMLGEAGKEPKIGEPMVAGASVTAEVLEQARQPFEEYLVPLIEELKRVDCLE